jgi:hypothetical protein
MSTTSPATLEDAIRHSGEGWLLDWFVPQEKALKNVQDKLAELSARAQQRLGKNAPDFSEAAILREYHRNPQGVRGFFQAFGSARTPDMLLMAWRIIQGMDIKEVELSYHLRQDFEVRVVLESLEGEESYSSRNINDFALFRHVGILEIGGKPAFDGFYALKLQKT